MTEDQKGDRLDGKTSLAVTWLMSKKAHDFVVMGLKDFGDLP